MCEAPFINRFYIAKNYRSELAHFTLVGFLMRPGKDQIVYVIVRLVMLLSGYFMLYSQKTLLLTLIIRRIYLIFRLIKRQFSPKLALIHRFIASWGTNSFCHSTGILSRFLFYTH